MFNGKKTISKYLLLLVLLLNTVYAQKSNIIHFTTEQGLIQTQINSIVQDQNGALIICSRGSGVVIYDGNTFAPFPFQNENIKPDNILNIYKDSKGNLWFCSYDGLIKYDGRKSYFFTTKDGLPDNEVNVIREDKKGVFWIGSKTGLTKYDGKFSKVKEIENKKVIDGITTIAENNNGGIWFANGAVIQKLQNGKLKTYQTPIPSPWKSVKQLYSDSKNRLWIATVAGLYYIEDDSVKKFTTNKILAGNSILKIYENKYGNLWFSVRDYGVVRYDRKEFKQFNEKNGLSSDLVYEIFQDNEHNIWFGTNEGLDLYAIEAFTKYDKTNGLPENLVWSVFEDNKKELWIVTDRAGISILKNGVVNRFDKQKTIDAKQYYAVYQDHRGIYWLATRTGLYSYDGTNIKKIGGSSALGKNGSSAICGDSKNNLWFCTFEDGIFKYDGKTITQFNDKNGLLGGEVLYAFDDGIGNVWISTSLGISIYDGKNFKNYPVSSGPVTKDIFTFRKDKKGNIWGASYGSGLFRIRRSENGDLSVKQITTKDGLTNNLIYLIEIDDYDHLWIGTQVGLCMLSLKDYYDGERISIKRYNKEDGIPHAEYNQASSFKAPDGILWFGTNKGLIRCDPSKIRVNTIEPKTIIKDLKIFYRDEDLSKYGKVIDNNLPSDLRLPYDMNHVTIEFVGISLTNSSKVRYKYILENFDKEWREATTKNFETYSNLPSGNYTFKIMSCNDDGVWNKIPVSYSFTILTPYYKTWWFISLIVLALVSSSWLIYKLRMRKIQLLNKELQKSLSEKIVTEKKLIQSENDYRGLFKYAHDAILIIDPIHQTIMAANNEASRMYGYSNEELIGLSFSEITTDFDKAKLNLLDAMLVKGWSDYEIKHINKMGELIDVEADATMINYNGRESIVAIMHNVTARKKIEKALIESKEQAEKSNLLKSNFLAQMSHEIRTPINTILSYTSLLKSEVEEKLPEEMKESFQFIENGGHRLIRTIDSILNMSQIQSGNQEVFPEKIKLYTDILLKLYKELKQTAVNKSLDFSVENSASNDLIMGDNYSLSQLFANLIDNAIKYTPAGKVIIILENKNSDTITVSIKDTGIGMSEEFIPNVFQPFSQEEMGYTRHFEGNGLGLALVKSYCVLNKGNIEVESKKGEGTTFTVTFALIKE